MRISDWSSDVCSSDLLERRLRSRSQDSDEVIAARMKEAHDEIAHHAEYDYLIVNESFEHALAEMVAICLEPRLRSQRQLTEHAGLVAQLLAPAAGGRVSGYIVVGPVSSAPFEVLSAGSSQDRKSTRLNSSH